MSKVLLKEVMSRVFDLDDVFEAHRDEQDMSSSICEDCPGANGAKGCENCIHMEEEL